jgi:hypothetical protein
MNSVILLNFSTARKKSLHVSHMSIMRESISKLQGPGMAAARLPYGLSNTRSESNAYAI